MLVTVDVYSLFVRSRQFQPTPPAFGAYNGRDPVGVLPISMASEGLSWGTVSMILRLAILVEHRLVTDRQTYDYGIYHASMASRGKNVRIQHRSLWKTVSVQFATPRSNWYLHLCGPKIWYAISSWTNGTDQGSTHVKSFRRRPVCVCQTVAHVPIRSRNTASILRFCSNSFSIAVQSLHREQLKQKLQGQHSGRVARHQ